MLTYVPVARTEDIPQGAFEEFEVYGQSAAVYNLNGSYVAYKNSCPHECFPIAQRFWAKREKDTFQDGIIKCYAHGWRFNACDGTACQSPNEHSTPLEPFPIRVVNEEIQLGVYHTTDTLSTTLTETLVAVVNSTQQHSNRRLTAVRWFNRLYYDLSKWQKQFLSLLREYSSIHKKPTRRGLDEFRQRLAAISDPFCRSFDLFSDSDGHPDICNRIEFLGQRLAHDFSWLRESDPQIYHRIRHAVMTVESQPKSFSKLVLAIRDRFEDVDRRLKTIQSRSLEEIEREIDDYAKAAEVALHAIHTEAKNLGVALLTVDEYDLALEQSGSRSPQIVVMGEISMSQDTYHIDNRGGILNIKTRLDKVSQAVSSNSQMDEPFRVELQSLMQELRAALKPIEETHREDSERVVTQIESATSEVCKTKPDREYLKIVLRGLERAGESLVKVAKPAVDVIAKVLALFAKYG